MSIRIPKAPPPIDWEALHRPMRSLSKTSRTVNGKYLHWDELRLRPRPEGQTHPEWWTHIKLARRLDRNWVPGLESTDGGPFGYVVLNRFHELFHRIDQGAGGRVELPGDITSAHDRDRFIVASLMEEAVTSSMLEGAVTTRQEAVQMLRSSRKPASEGERMVFNNYLVMQKLRSLRDEPMTIELLCQIQGMLTRKTDLASEHVGHIRRTDDVVVSDDYQQTLHVPPLSAELPERLERMCRFANGEPQGHFVHPLLRAIILHFWLAYEHPFVDGNGRTARALFYWAMLRANYWLFEYVSISRTIFAAPKRYYRAFLFTETDDNDLTYFIDYHMDVAVRAMEALHAYIERKTAEVRQSEARLQVMETLNHRQKSLIAHALRKAGYSYRIESHRGSHNVAYQTARTDLLDLEERGFLRKIKVGRQFVFKAPKDLARRLGAAD